jgi:hypothetical protein
MRFCLPLDRLQLGGGMSAPKLPPELLEVLATAIGARHIGPLQVVATLADCPRNHITVLSDGPDFATCYTLEGLQLMDSQRLGEVAPGVVVWMFHATEAGLVELHRAGVVRRMQQVLPLEVQQ